MSHTVLVADDSLTIRQIVGMALKASPYRLVEAASARQTIEAAQARPDVILLDYYMPDGSGYDVCRALKNNAATRHIPVVMLGGSYKNFDERMARQAGADGVVVKPFKTDQLLQAIEGALRGGGAHAASAPQLSQPGPAALGQPSRPQAPPAPQAAQGLALPMPGQSRQPSPPMPSMPGPAQPSPTMPGAALGRQPLPAPAPQPAPRAGQSGFNSGSSSPRLDPSPPAPMHAPQPAQPSSGGVGMDRAELEEFLREEVRKVVRDELPNLLRNVMGDLLQQKLMPKLLKAAEERVEVMVQDQITHRIQTQVRAELEQLLNE